MTRLGQSDRITVKTFREVSLPVDVTDERAFPNIAASIRRLESLPPERRAELERDWL